MKKIIILFIACLFIYSCGYKKVNNSQKQNFYIKNINIDGNKKIGYFLKNEIASISSLNGSTKIDVNLDVEKEKKEIKEYISKLREEKERQNVEKNRLENDLNYIEKLAREKYLMSKPGEKVFRIIPKEE